MRKRIPSPSEDWLAVQQAARRNYGNFRHVLGVGVGLKFVEGRARGESWCLQFYVRRKIRRVARRHRLPAFVYGRARAGKVDRTRRHPTDIIEMRSLRFACLSGSPIDVIGESGAATLLFENRIPGHAGTYMLTCAHVAGNLEQSPPTDPTIHSPHHPQDPGIATTLVNSTHRRGVVDYDIALAKMTDQEHPHPVLRVVDSPVRLRRFLPPEEVRPGLMVDSAFPVSGAGTAQVASLRVSLPLTLDGRLYEVRNLFLLRRTPRPGDSGGLLYVDDAAAGILVGLAEGWGLFQPLAEAFEHLQTLTPLPLAVFSNYHYALRGAGL